ncbi:MAG: ParA family protein [Rickettsiales bacterium]|nr:MAG: ParA family protein [Rickettsiales bacterium]
MAITISLSNHKGGVGKTTSTINISAALNQMGKKVLMIDLDPQANLTQSLGIKNPILTIYDALKGNSKVKPLTILKGFDLIPSTLDLSAAEIELSGEAGREYILKEVLQPFSSSYDYIMIDCPPSLGLLTINAFTTSDEVIIPVQAQFLATQGMTKLIEIIEKIQKRLNKSLKLGGVVITQFDSRKVLNRNVVEMINEHFSNRVFNSKIRDNISLAEAPAMSLDIFRYNPKSNGAEDYMSLAKEITVKSK